VILTFTAQIVGAEIHCEIGSNKALTAPTFCFSLMAAARVISGGILTRSVASYSEIALPNIAANSSIKLVLAYAEPDFFPRNRAWLPLGAYLRVGSQTHALPPLPAGILDAPAKPNVTLPATTLRLIPQPADWQPTGEVRAFSAITHRHPSLITANDLTDRLTLPPLLTPTGEPITIQNTPDLPPEAYVLTITPTHITIAASADHGIFNAAMTLLSLRETYAGNLPCGTITDTPRFAWRGQHLDCARHFFTVPTILRLLDLMALFKLNRFHWHLSDDEAFRLQVTTAPDLWRKTEFRGEGLPIPGVFGGGIRAGGSYSKADVQTVLKRAAQLHIEVLPEIEIPAHGFALNKAMSGLRDHGDNGAEVSVQGYSDNVINPALPAVWALLEPLCAEVAALFPIGILHLGCDELPPGAWDGSPAIKALMAEKNLENRDDVQGWMMDRLACTLRNKGIRSAAWEEAAKGANGGINHNAILFSWTGQGPGVEAARRGNDVVMCPAQNLYFDLAHSDDPNDWGAAWAGFVSLEQTINWRPIPKGAEDIAHRIIGIQACLWAECITEDAQIEPMLAPRILGLANKAWDCHDSIDGLQLRGLAQEYAPMFDRIGWRRNPAA
jgi:hexosaminidase